MARELAMALADAVGQHDLGGPQLVNLFHAGICDEERLRLAADFASGTSTVWVLSASIALGMGQNLSQLYTVWAINPPCQSPILDASLELSGSFLTPCISTPTTSSPFSPIPTPLHNELSASARAQRAQPCFSRERLTTAET